MSAPFALTGIDHVVLLVEDMERATAFYTDVVGCSIDNDLPQYGMRQLRAGAALIDLVDVSSEGGAWARPEIAGGRNVDHIALGLAPADQGSVRRHLAEQGVEIVEEGDRIGALGDTLSFYIRDPDGNQIELSFRPHDPQSRNSTYYRHDCRDDSRVECRSRAGLRSVDVADVPCDAAIGLGGDSGKAACF